LDARGIGGDWEAKNPRREKLDQAPKRGEGPLDTEG